MTDARTPYSNIEIRDLEAHHTAVVRVMVARDGIPEALGQIFQAVQSALREQGVDGGGSPFARWHAFGDQVDMEAGVMVQSPIVTTGQVEPGNLPGGRAAIAVHPGPYEGLPVTYDAIEAWLTESGNRASGGPWEIYLTDPSEEPDPSRWLTEVIYPLEAG